MSDINTNGSSVSTLSFTPVSPLLIRPYSTGQFSIYLKQSGRYVLYTSQGEAFTHDHRNNLFNLGVKEVYILSDQLEHYDGYLEENLGQLLADEDIPIQERCGAMYEASVGLARDVFSDKLPKPLTAKGFERVRRLVEISVEFLGNEQGLKHLAKLISHDYEVYTHSVNTMIFTALVLQTFEDVDEATLVHTTMGAILHDFGKSRVSKRVLTKRQEALSQEEREQLKAHPALGAALCAQVPIARDTLLCILFHHEHADGKGYPSGLRGEDIPLFVRVLSVCNAYDNLTSDSPHKEGLGPFDALQQLKQRRGEFDTEMIRRLILVLANADIIKA